MQLLCMVGVRIACNNTAGKAEGKKSPRYRLGCTVNMNEYDSKPLVSIKG